MKFLEGEEVLAKLPSTQEYEKAKIVNVKGSKYKVVFKGGVEHTINESDVKAQRTSRSQTRSRGRPAGKSPSRNSPSRKSPARRSPARSPTLQSRKLPLRSTRQAKISLARLEIPKDNSSDTDRTEGSESLKDEFVELQTQSRLRELGPVTRRSIRIMSNASKAEHEQKLMMLTRGGDRAASLPVERKFIQYNAADEKERGLSVQRDEDLLKMMHYEEDAEPGSERKPKEVDLVSKPQEWGGWIGALLLILALPTCTILLQLACSNNHCSYKKFRIPQYKEWRILFNLEAFLLYAGFLIFVALISIIPIGRVVDGQQSKSGILQYRINGIWALILSLAAFGGCFYQGYDISAFLLKRSLPLAVAGSIYGTILALTFYIKGGRAPVSNLNIYGSTNNFIYDFWQGREINPRIGSLDIKLLLLRFAMITTIIINISAIIKVIRESESYDLNNLNLPAILVASLQIIYVLDSIIFESSMVTSFEITYEGTGYMLFVGYLVYPYLATIATRYLLINKVQQSIYLLSLPVLFFFFGYAIYRMSNSQKDKFRKNPFSPSVSHLETIPTKRGKRLIISGLWGHVRHPNYLGDIIMHWSIASLCFSTDFLPYVLAIEVTLALIHRAIRDNARCEKRYGYAWEQYCSRVKYMILKWVF